MPSASCAGPAATQAEQNYYDELMRKIGHNDYVHTMKCLELSGQIAELNKTVENLQWSVQELNKTDENLQWSVQGLLQTSKKLHAEHAILENTIQRMQGEDPRARGSGGP